MNFDALYDLKINDILSVLTIHTEKGKIISRTNRECWAIILKYEGETIYKNLGKTYISNRDNMIILPKGSDYEWHCTESGRFYTIEFDCDKTCDSIFSFPIDNCEKFLQLYKDSDYKRTVKKPFYKYELFKNLYSILTLLLQSKNQVYTPPSKKQKITPAVEYITANYTSQIKNDFLASLTGLSTIYFRKIFTEVYGTPPITYVHKLRIKKAKEMLDSDYKSISDVAFSLGYADIYDFSRTFKKHTGVSPLNYKKYKKKT